MNTLKLSDRDAAALDRPIWSSLHSKHRALAQGGPLAFRYPPTIAPFAAVPDLSPAAVSALLKLAADAPVALLSDGPLEPLDGLEVQATMVVCQMVLAGGIPAMPDFTPELLGAADVPAMLELTALTKPGPFLPETYRLGRYIGIREGGRLAAMAGERMRLDGFTEISAVCVHPDFRGKGYAQMLVKNLMNTIAADGTVPFLHVVDENRGAIALYERLGFAIRSKRNFTVMRRPASA
jgi:ribosomal protein S18 acetylase RimI-like enzyme